MRQARRLSYAGQPSRLTLGKTAESRAAGSPYGGRGGDKARDKVDAEAYE